MFSVYGSIFSNKAYAFYELVIQYVNGQHCQLTNPTVCEAKDGSTNITLNFIIKDLKRHNEA